MGRVPFDHIDCKGEDVEPSAPHGSSSRRIQGHLHANEQSGRPTILTILHHRVVLIGGRGVKRAGSQVPPSPPSRGSFRLLTASGVSAAEDGRFHPYLVPLRSRFLTSIRLHPDPTGGERCSRATLRVPVLHPVDPFSSAVHVYPWGIRPSRIGPVLLHRPSPASYEPSRSIGKGRRPDRPCMRLG